MAVVRVVEPRRRRPRKRKTVVRCTRTRRARAPTYSCTRHSDLTGGFLPLIPLIAAAIGAAPAIASTVIAAKNANR